MGGPRHPLHVGLPPGGAFLANGSLRKTAAARRTANPNRRGARVLKNRQPINERAFCRAGPRLLDRAIFLARDGDARIPPPLLDSCSTRLAFFIPRFRLPKSGTSPWPPSSRRTCVRGWALYRRDRHAAVSSGGSINNGIGTRGSGTGNARSDTWTGGRFSFLVFAAVGWCSVLILDYGALRTPTQWTRDEQDE